MSVRFSDTDDDKILELVAAVDGEMSNAIGHYYGDLSNDRSEALDLYNGEPLGNEQEGRSDAMSNDVRDTILAMLPSLLKTFTGSDKAVVFEPVDADDIQLAEQQTVAVNHVFYKLNNGFMVLHDALFDALLTKRGFIKVGYEETEDVSEYPYSGLSEQELEALAQDPSLEITEMEKTLGPDGGTIYDVTFKKIGMQGKIVIDAIPPEEISVARNTRILADSNFVCHKVETSASELVAMGYDREFVDGLVGDDMNMYSPERLARDTTVEESFPMQRGSASDTSQSRRIILEDCYIRYDWDDDGVAELRRVLKVGNDVLENYIVPRIPIATGCPVPMSHRFNGLSITDLVKDIQKQKTVLLRQFIDNLVLTNHPRLVVNENVNMMDALSDRIGGLIRIRGMSMPGASVTPLVMPQIGDSTLKGLEYIDTIKENRTGVTKYNQGMDSNSLNKTASGINQIMAASQQRIELIARILAETLVKDTFILINKTMIEHPDPEMVVNLNGTYTRLDPTEWKDRDNVSVRVGLGTGEEDRKAGQLMQVLQMQKEAMAAGGMGIVVTEKTMYNTAKDMLDVMGVKGVDKYFVDPDSPAAQQAKQAKQKPSIEEQQLELDKVKVQGDLKLREMEIKLKYEMKAKELMAETRLTATELALRDGQNASREAHKINKEYLDNEARTRDLDIKEEQGGVQRD